MVAVGYRFRVAESQTLPLRVRVCVTEDFTFSLSAKDPGVSYVLYTDQRPAAVKIPSTGTRCAVRTMDNLLENETPAAY